MFLPDPLPRELAVLGLLGVTLVAREDLGCLGFFFSLELFINFCNIAGFLASIFLDGGGVTVAVDTHIGSAASSAAVTASLAAIFFAGAVTGGLDFVGVACCGFAR